MTTILLVEEDPLAAQPTLSLLGSRFGEVRRVADAAAALCAIEEPDFAAKLSLVISAHLTRGIGGPVFVAELCERMPGLPVLVLGAPGASAADYRGSHIEFLPAHSEPEKMVTLVGQLLARENGSTTR